MRDRPVSVLVVRGHQVTPWELRPWEDLPDRYRVSYLRTARNEYDSGSLRLDPVPARALSSFLPRGRLGSLVTGVTGDRYIDPDGAYAAADIVHAEELSYWFAADAARRKARHGYLLVLTVWETIPLRETYRNRHARRYRRETLAAADLFLAATERAREGLLMEGVEPDRVRVCYPGIDVGRFGEAGRPDPPPDTHVVVSPGRLVWEKGHQDVMRAVAAIRDGLVPGRSTDVHLLVVGSGPEKERLRDYARELGLEDRIEFRSVPYAEMPSLFARASCMVLASLPYAGAGYVLGDVPRFFWEEQFGLVLAEALAAGLPVVASTCGAIPEVCGDAALYFAPGDWMELARRLAEGPLAQRPGARAEHPPELVHRYSTEAMAERLAAAYDELMARS